MHRYSRSALSDHALMQSLEARAAGQCTSTAELLADMAEVDIRGLHVAAGYPSMYLYCVDHLHMSEDEAFMRIRAARTGHQFPAIFAAVADGRLHLSAVVMLSPRLTVENAGELISAASHQTKAQIASLLAQRFPQPDVPTMIEAMAAPAPAVPTLAAPAISGNQLVPEPVDSHHLPASVAPPPSAPPPRVKPLAPERFALQVTIDQGTHDLLRQAQALLGHQVPAGDVARVLHRALELLVHQLAAAAKAPARARMEDRAPSRGIAAAP